MAIQVILRPGMNGPSTTLENATKYMIEDHYLHLYEGNKRVVTYSPGSWESVKQYTPLDKTDKKQLVALDGERVDKALSKPKIKKPKKAAVKTREGAGIRTSPTRGEGLPTYVGGKRVR